MKKKILFRYKSKLISNLDILNALRKIKVSESDIVYAHTDINFGFPNHFLKKNDLLDSLLKIFKKLKLKTLIFPTYTFSFCKNEIFNYYRTETKMGVLNEFIRKKYKDNRSLDPLLSNVLIGKNQYLVRNIGKQSIGKNSTFDLMAKSNEKIKFVFFGSSLHKCFTFMHYLEFIEKVNYRYQRNFSGIIVDNKKQYKDKFQLFVRYSDINSSNGSLLYEQFMKKNKILNSQKVGLSSISCVEMNYAINSYLDFLKKDKNFFIKKPYNRKKNLKIFKKNENIVSL